MTVSITYAVEIDIDKTNFASGQLDVSGRCLGFRAKEGADSAYEAFAQPAQAALTLYNGDNAFFPDGGGAYAGDIKRGLLVRVQMTYSTTQQLWYGWIDSWSYETDPHSQYPVVVVSCIDKSHELYEAEYAPRLEQDVRVDTEIAQVLEDVMALPYAASSAGHAVYDYSVYDSAYYGDNTAYIDLETAQTTLDYTGDVPLAEQERLNARQYIEELVMAEMEGLFWWSGRAGKYRFLDRHYEFQNATIQATVGDRAAAPVLAAGPGLYGDDVINRATIYYTIRKTGTIGATLYELDEPFVVYPGKTREFTANYHDPDAPTARCSGLDMITPVAETDYTVNQISDGSGANYIQHAQVNVEFGAQSARISVYNLSNVLPIWVTSFKLRGTPLLTYDQRSVTVSNATSVGTHGYHRYTGALNLINSAELAEEYANALVGQRATAYLRIPAVTFNANQTVALAEYARDVEIGDRITLDLTNYGSAGHNANYTVVGIQYQYSTGQGGALPQLITTWILRPAARVIGALYDDPAALYDSATYAF